MLIRSSPAKINLFLNLRGLRDDGYHEMLSVMQAVAIYDRLTLIPLSNGSGLKLTTDHPELNQELEKDPNNNIINRAYHCFWNWTKQEPQAMEIHLKKNIPVQAGMGGGSSDAAATLLLLDELTQSQLSKETLEEMAASLGSDVPFFIRQGTALTSGRGEKITPIKIPKKNSALPVLIVKPKSFGISTAKAYEYCREANQYKNRDVNPLSKVLEKTPTTKTLNPTLHNDFEPVLFPQYPQLQEIAKKMRTLGITRPLLSGSGPTMIGFLETEFLAPNDTDLKSEETKKIEQVFPESDYQVFSTHTLP